MKFSQNKKYKMRKIRLKKLKYVFNSLSRHSCIDYLTYDERVLILISKFEYNGHYYLLCKNEILHKANIYELGYVKYPYLRCLTNNQIQKTKTIFKEWINKVNSKEKSYYIKYIIRDTGKIEMRSTMEHLLRT